MRAGTLAKRDAGNCVSRDGTGCDGTELAVTGAGCVRVCVRPAGMEPDWDDFNIATACTKYCAVVWSLVLAAGCCSTGFAVIELVEAGDDSTRPVPCHAAGCITMCIAAQRVFGISSHELDVTEDAKTVGLRTVCVVVRDSTVGLGVRTVCVVARDSTVGVGVRTVCVAVVGATVGVKTVGLRIVCVPVLDRTKGVGVRMVCVAALGGTTGVGFRTVCVAVVCGTVGVKTVGLRTVYVVVLDSTVGFKTVGLVPCLVMLLPLVVIFQADGCSTVCVAEDDTETEPGAANANKITTRKRNISIRHN